MELVVKEIPAQKIVAMAHIGPYHEIGSTFGKLSQWIEKTGTSVGDMIGVYHDDPMSVAPEQLRSHAAALVPLDFTIDCPDVEVLDLAGGKYATGIHVGDYAKMGEVWMELYGKLIPAAGLAADETTRPPFERYIKDCDVEGMEKAETELYVPIA